MEGRCIKCGRHYHLARDYKVKSIAETYPCNSNANQEPVQNQIRFNKLQLKITKLSLEEDLGNEEVVPHKVSDILFNTHCS